MTGQDGSTLCPNGRPTGARRHPPDAGTLLLCAIEAVSYCTRARGSVRHDATREQGERGCSNVLV